MPFQNKELESIAHEIARDELEHVRLLRDALGAGAVAKPELNLDALGIGFKSDGEFVALARAFEDVGVSAYRGAAKLIQNKDYVDVAAGILATEAYHAGNIRAHAIYGRFSSPKFDGKDQPPTDQNSIPTDKNILVSAQTLGGNRATREPKGGGSSTGGSQGLARRMRKQTRALFFQGETTSIERTRTRDSTRI